MYQSQLKLALPFRTMLVVGLAAPLSVAMATPREQRFQPLDDLDRVIIAQTGAAIGQAGGAITPIDRRLRLTKCSHSPIFRHINDRLGAISCEAPMWRIRVPLVSAATNESSTKVDETDAAAAPALDKSAVVKGAKVQILVREPSINFTTDGIAMEDGAIGMVISVKAEPFNKNVKARVIDFETVELIEDPPSSGD